MTFKLSFYIFVFLSFTTQSTTYAQVDTIVEDKKFNYISWHNNGQIHELGNYLAKGKKITKQGYWIVYDETGEVVEKGTYARNKKEGPWTERGSDHNCCWTGIYKNNKKEGEWFNGANRMIIYQKGKQKEVKIIEWKR